MVSEDAAPIPVSGGGDLRGRVALVTGSARGIGRSIAVTLAEAGADVAVLDVLDLADTVSALEATGWRTWAYEVDVSSRERVLEAVNRIAEDAGRIDVLVTAAAVAGQTPDLNAVNGLSDGGRSRECLFREPQGDDLVHQAALPHLRQRGGSIICIGSLAAKTGGLFSGPTTSPPREVCIHWSNGSRDTAPATASAPTWSLRARRHRDDEGPTALGREGHPADIAQAVRFLASDASNFITGTVLDVNGGQVMD